MKFLLKMLPAYYQITPEPSKNNNFSLFLEQLKNKLIAGEKLIQLRAKVLSPDYHDELALASLILCHQYGAKLLINSSMKVSNINEFDGIHLDGKSLSTLQSRPCQSSKIVGASCHNLEQIKKAEILAVDFITLSPVCRTTSHPEAVPMGWDAFKNLCLTTRLPVFALGGMSTNTLDQAVMHGAHGIAAISTTWKV